MVIPTSQCLGPRNSQDSLEWKADAEPFTELCFEQQDFTQKVRILFNLASLVTNQSFGVENRDLLKRRRWGIFFFCKTDCERKVFFSEQQILEWQKVFDDVTWHHTMASTNDKCKLGLKLGLDCIRLENIWTRYLFLLNLFEAKKIPAQDCLKKSLPISASFFLCRFFLFKCTIGR